MIFVANRLGENMIGEILLVATLLFIASYDTIKHRSGKNS
jgi:hypothetical protein